MSFIDSEVGGTLPVVNIDFRSAMSEIMDLMGRSIQLNFDVGGRPSAWPSLRNGVRETILVGTGKLRRSIFGESDETSATQTAISPYARIHNEGGTIHHPGSSKRQAFRIGEKWIVTNYTKPHDIVILQRKFMMFQEQDIIRYKQILGEVPFKTSESTTSQRIN